MVIPEDPALDQYILKPIVERMFLDLGRNARVQVLSNPRLRGVVQALDAATVARVVAMYPMIDLFCIMVDRDAEPGRPVEAGMREAEHPDRLMVCLAVEEVEVWMLAVHRERLVAPWPGYPVRARPEGTLCQAIPGGTCSQAIPGRRSGLGHARPRQQVAGRPHGVSRARSAEAADRRLARATRGMRGD
jgi:hypothetical protein